METFGAVLFDLFGTLVDERGQAVTGAAEVLGSLPHGRWAIVTSCGSRLARGLVREAGLPEPALLISADDVSRGKPAPDCYLLAAERLAVAPRECLVVEDSPQGLAAAKAAGMEVLNVREVALSDLAFELGLDERLRLRR